VNSLVRESKRLGMAHRSKLYKKLRKITPEEALENYKAKARRLAEKMGWNDTWLKDAKDRRNIKSHKSRVKHSGHGK